MEQWRQIKDWPYSVSDQGRIRSDRSGRILKPGVNTGGYLHVTLTANGKQQNVRVHKAVLDAFVGPRKKKQECRHLDRDRTNNYLTNLCWGTTIQNRADQRRHGTDMAGERNGRCVLTEKQARDIKRLIPIYGVRPLARLLGLPRHLVHNIHIGVSWKHLTDGG